MKGKKRLLIVEDEFFLAETLKARLEFLGYEVLCAENGEEALKLLEKESLHLIVMDYMMPVINGIEATKRIKAHEKWKKIPVIFLSARARPEDQEEAREAGADDYLVKPFEMATFISIIEKWLS